MCQHGAFPPLLEPETQERILTHDATGQLPWLILKPSKFRRLVNSGHACVWLNFMSNRTFCWMSVTRSITPSPVLQLVKTKGLSPRIILESFSITSRLAPTYEAR